MYYKVINPHEKNTNNWTKLELNVPDCQVVHFHGMNQTNKVDWTKSAIIISDEPQYPNIDVLIFHASDGLLLACQVTVTDPFTKHSRNFFGIPFALFFLSCPLFFFYLRWHSAYTTRNKVSKKFMCEITFLRSGLDHDILYLKIYYIVF